MPPPCLFKFYSSIKVQKKRLEDGSHLGHINCLIVWNFGVRLVKNRVLCEPLVYAKICFFSSTLMFGYFLCFCVVNLSHASLVKLHAPN